MDLDLVHTDKTRPYSSLYLNPVILAGAEGLFYSF